jgi:hypothetical protein
VVSAVEGFLIVVGNSGKRERIKAASGFFTFRNLECFGLQPNNQEMYARTNAAAGISA